jgi:cyclophilin family peptidyl-prolyl cis-trans isomerase
MFKDEELNKFMLYAAITGILIITMACVLQLCFVPGSECKLPFISVDETEIMVFEDGPDFILLEGANYQAKVITSQGDFYIDLYQDNAPKTVNNFVFLVSKGYYDGVKFHRIFPDLLIQTGDRNTLDDDPNNDGMGGPGYAIDDEINWTSAKIPTKQQGVLISEGYSSTTGLISKPIRRYSLAMANSGKPNTNGSQFFVTLQDEGDTQIASLRGRHTVFAIVTRGFEVIDKIAKTPVDDPDGEFPTPLRDVYIKTIEVIETPPDSKEEKIIHPDQTVRFN